jgi:proteasome lid subunit RPN8/RPN11
VIYEHVFANADREVGGILVGRAPVAGGLPLVTGAIPAVSADERQATLTFTQDAWAHIHRTLEREFPPDEQIVGWYHSHPGFGIFLSGHDTFIHEHFFGAPSQIALVIDPQRCREGVFVWRDRELTPLFERLTPNGWAPSPRGPDEPGLGSPPCPLPNPPSGSKGGIAVSRGPARGHVTGRERMGYPLLALAVAAILGVIVGFASWTLIEGGTAERVPPVPPPAHTRTHAARRPHTETPRGAQNHIEIIGE